MVAGKRWSVARGLPRRSFSGGGLGFRGSARLEASDLIAGDWTTIAEGRRIKAYALTTAGKRQLNAETKQWERIVAAVSQVLQLT